MAKGSTDYLYNCILCCKKIKSFNNGFALIQ